MQSLQNKIGKQSLCQAEVMVSMIHLTVVNAQLLPKKIVISIFEEIL